MTRRRMIVPTALLAAGLVSTSPAGAAGAPGGGAAGALVPASITRSDFLTQAQIRDRLDLARPLSEHLVLPTDRSPGPDPDCATAGRPEATSAQVHPARRSRTQYFAYEVPGAPWQVEGRVLVLEYASRARARAAYRRAKASVELTRRYSLICEGINPIISGQVRTSGVDVPGRSFTWRYRLRAGHAGSWRDVIATRGRRVVWVELGRTFTADLDWSAGRPPAVFPRYPSRHYLESLGQAAVARAL